MKKHILIVDDEAPIRDILAQLLGEHGYRISEAENAAEARNLARTDPPDLIISDLQLEESDGLTLVSQLKAQHPDIPVLLLTGVLFDAEVVQETLMKVVTSYLPKTAPLAKILAEVKRCTGGD